MLPICRERMMADCFHRVKVQKDGKVVAYKTAYFGQVLSKPGIMTSH